MENGDNRYSSSQSNTDNIIMVQIVPSKKNTIDKVSQCVPIFLSILAISISIYSQHNSIKHSKLSVKPDVRILKILNEKEDKLGLFLENRGFGPGHVKNVRIYFHGKNIDNDNFGLVVEKTKELYTDGKIHWSGFKYGLTVKVGEEYPVFYTETKNLKNIEKFKELIDKDIFYIGEVCSIYNECNYFCSSVDDESCLREEIKIIALSK